MTFKKRDILGHLPQCLRRKASEVIQTQNCVTCSLYSTLTLKDIAHRLPGNIQKHERGKHLDYVNGLYLQTIQLKYDQKLCRVKTFFDAISALFA